MIRVAFLFLLSYAAWGQEANSGIALPVTLSGDARYSGSSEDGYGFSGGFRALVSPTVQLGPHWFGYAVLGAQSSDYFTYSIGADTDQAVSFTLMQAYIGYKAEFKSATLLLKAGRLTSAFGHYALEYDDAKSPMIEPPSLYSANLPLRPDQIPCNLHDVVWQDYANPVEFGCGGSTSERYGIVPTTLYGIPGVEIGRAHV